MKASLKTSKKKTSFQVIISIVLILSNWFKTRKKLNISFLELSDDANLGVIPEDEIAMAKNVSSSPMVFTTKMLYKLFRVDELLGHNVSGKTFNKFIKNKKALDEKRINYIRWLVERNFEADNREELWKACRTAINKSIRNHEIKAGQLYGIPDEEAGQEGAMTTIVKLSNEMEIDGEPAINENKTKKNSVNKNNNSNNTLITLQPTMTIVQMTNDLPPSTSSLDEDMIYQNNINSEEPVINKIVVKLGNSILDNFFTCC
jgi:hypothetical protein